MNTDHNDDALGSSFFDHRLLVEIQAWDADLHLGLSSDLAPVEHRFQGGLSYVRGFHLDGRVVAPARHRAKAARVWLSPFGPDMRFGSDGLDEVGQLHIYPPSAGKADFNATLLVPEASLSVAATCLSSVWRYLHIWTFDEEVERASVSAFSFSSTIHKNLEAWAGKDQSA